MKERKALLRLWLRLFHGLWVLTCFVAVLNGAAIGQWAAGLVGAP